MAAWAIARGLPNITPPYFTHMLARERLRAGLGFSGLQKDVAPLVARLPQSKG